MPTEKPTTVLVIDDEDAIRASIRNFLEDHDYGVLEGENGRIGLGVFGREQPDAILVDLRMPEVDGLEVLAEVRRRSPETPTIVVSGTGIIGDAVEALHRGAWDYVLKPIEDLSVLLHALERTLERARLLRENREYQMHLEDEVARQTQELKELNDRLRAIVASTEALASCSSIGQIGEELLREFAKNMAAEGGSLYLVEGDQLVLAHSLDPDHAVEVIPLPLEDWSVFATALREKHAVLIRDIEADGNISSGWTGYRDGSLLAFPLLSGTEDPIGVLALHNKKRPPFTEQDREIGQILASYSFEALCSARATEEVRKSEARFRALFEQANDAIFMHTLDGEILSVNEQACQMLGYDYDQVVKMRIPALHPEQELAACKQAIQDAVEKGSARFESKFMKADGTLVDVEISARVIDREHGIVQGIARDVTARKQSEEALRRSEARLRTVVRSSKDAMIAIGRDGLVTIFNPAAQEMFGRTADEMMRQPLDRLMPEDYREKHGEHVASFFAHGEPRGAIDKTVELTGLRSSGEEFPVELTLSVGLHGSEPLVLAVIRDITTRKQAEEALRASEERMRSIVGGMPVLLDAFDANGTVVYWNEACERATGYQASEMVNNTDALRLLYPDEDYRNEVLASIRKEGGDFRHLEFELTRKDGARRVISWTNISDSLPIPGWATWAIGIDVTEPRRAEQERARLATVVEQAAEGIIIADRQGTIKYVNPAFERASGYSAEEAIGRTPDFLESGEHDEALFRELWHTIERGGAWSGRIVSKRKDGTLYHVESTISPIRDAAGMTTGYVTLRRNVTREMELETQLRQAQKMEAIGTLAGGIAHDFNNILSPIVGYTEMALVDLPEDSRTASDLQEVLTASRRAADLVTQILTFSRQQEEERHPIRVCPIAKEALKLLRASLPSTIEMRPRIVAEPDVVLADPTQIHQVLMNLCTNAGHAMRETGGTLTVELTNLDATAEPPHEGLEPGHYLRLTVADTGHGMEPDVLARIFEPYFTTKETGEGTGLGLAVVHGIVESYGGAIAVESEIGRGTTFEILLPLAEREEADAAASGPAPRGRERVLLVDDEPTVVEMVQQMLERLGYEVVSHTSSTEALAAFERGPDQFDLVVTDMTMPHMTGTDLSKELMEIRPDVPIIMCTGFSELITEGKAEAMGIRALLMKPIVRRDLAEAIRRAFGEGDEHGDQ